MSNASKLRVMVVACLAALGGCNSGTAEEVHRMDRDAVKVRHQADQGRGRVWILTPYGVSVFDGAAPYPVRRVSLPAWIWMGEPRGRLPGLAVGPKGEAVVSSDAVPTLWRVDPDTFEVSRHLLQLDADADRDVGFAQIEYSAEQDAYFAVGTFDGARWRIDPGLQRAQKLLR